MASIAARAVAREVLETIGKGKKANITKIAVKHGYTHTMAKSGQVQKTLTYQHETAKAIEGMERARQKAINALNGKDMEKEGLLTLSVVTKNLTHDIQLLSGRSTSNTEHTEDRRILVGIIEQLRGSTKPPITE